MAPVRQFARVRLVEGQMNSLAGLDDSFFDAEHPLHEAGPPAPLRPLLAAGPSAALDAALASYCVPCMIGADCAEQ